MVDGPAQRAAAGDCAGLPAAGAGAQAGRMDRGAVVALGVGRAAWISAIDAGARPGPDPAAVQQVHAVARGKPA